MAIDEKNRFLSIMILLLISTSVAAHAQAPDTLWTKMYGITGPYEWFQSVEQLPDNGYVLAGSWSEDLMLMRTDAQGDSLWTKIYGGIGDDCGFAATLTEDDGFVVVGLRATQNGDLWILKTDAAGDTLWTRTYGGALDDIGFCILQTADNGYVVLGQTESLGGIYGTWLIRTDPNGDTLWTRIYEDFAAVPGMSLHPTDDGGYIFATNRLNGIAYDAYLIKTDSAGNIDWMRCYSGLGSEILSSVTPTADGGYVAVGHTGQVGSLIEDGWILKANSAGDSLWAIVYGGPGHEEFRSVRQTLEGGFIVGGTKSLAPFAESHVWLMRLSADGDSTWGRIWSGGDAAECSGVDICADGGYILAGSAFLIETYDDAWLLKTEPDVRIEDSEPERICTISLTINPNPFSKYTEIRCSILDARHLIGKTALKIYDATGRTVKSLLLPTSYLLSSMPVVWDGTDEAHRRLGSGVYLCEMRTPTSRLIEKIIFVE